MSTNQHTLINLLCANHLLTAQGAADALKATFEQKMDLVQYVVKNHLVDATELANALAKALGEPILDLDAIDTKTLITDIIDPKILLKNHVLALSVQSGRLCIATSNPTRQDMLQELSFCAKMPVVPVLVEEHKLSKLIDKTLLGVSYELSDLPSAQTDTENTEQTTSTPDAPTVRFVHQVLHDALHMGASDIHFEPFEHSYRVRVRIDGVMRVLATPPKHASTQICARLKVMAHLDIAERRKPQDGRLKFTLTTGRAIDFRISTTPALFGEKVVLRLLDAAQALIGVKSLGMTHDQQQLFLDTLNRPQGMILITGPTGSGKTVSLYTALSLLNSDKINILTVEDPVEIYLEGINQVNVNPKIGLDFSDVLRSFLRQDPDVIMVGEIRDIQTADIAIKSAQTGHLVLSTLHTNSASDAIYRLKNMGIANFNIASSVSLIIAQRLARKLCKHCKRPINIPHQSLSELGFSDADIQRATLFEPVGCQKCHDGYHGRIGIYEMLPITKSIATLIMQDANVEQIVTEAAKLGIMTLYQSAMDKACQGIISLQDMQHVAMKA
ncbi:type IV-A pilus assembly ATPase PilB [Moraxella nasovis]|uniref:type IV-A pilus assembly ATPase PilB n=1 Tax=Moraxella nasovis TaxID=2904121 RepID=UPI001F60FE92|nr:type IV-A pilus assembly ATPase PilB [Moraxella nasovis]UNU72587.1 type IV-A pilus assembly ATPase PilB [Moraxella nasovis]